MVTLYRVTNEINDKMFVSLLLLDNSKGKIDKSMMNIFILLV